jgi:integrase
MAKIFQRKKTDPKTGRAKLVKTWWISYQENGKQIQRTLRTTSRQQAEWMKADIERNLEKGMAGLPPNFIDSSRIIAEFRAGVVDKLGVSWGKRVRQIIDQFERYLIDNKMHNLAKINTRVVESYLNSRAERIAAKTWNSELNILDRFFKFALRREYIAKNPVSVISKQHSEEPPIVIFSPEELGLVFKYARKDSLPLYKLLLFTGMRDGEARYLQWQDVDLTPGREHILVRNTPRHRTKTRRDRSVPLLPEAIALLKELDKARDPNNPYVLPAKKGQVRGHNRNTWKNTLARIEKATGVKIDKGKNLTGMHLFRHTFATNALASGVDIRTVQEVLGHSSILMTQRYTNLLPSQKYAQLQKVKIKIGSAKSDSQ